MAETYAATSDPETAAWRLSCIEGLPDATATFWFALAALMPAARSNSARPASTA